MSKAIDVLRHKIAVSKASADNESYDIGLSIAEGEAVLAENERLEKISSGIGLNQFCRGFGYGSEYGYTGNIPSSEISTNSSYIIAKMLYEKLAKQRRAERLKEKNDVKVTPEAFLDKNIGKIT